MAKKIKTKVENVTTFKQVENTPFMVVKNQGKHMICAGHAVLSEKTFDTFAQAKAYVESKPYELIVNLACYVMSHSKSLTQDGTSNEEKTA